MWNQNTAHVDQELLHEHVDSAEHIDDLIRILGYIPLNLVQNMLHQHIDELSTCDSDVLRKYRYRVEPIDNILPECIIQHVLSFNSLNHAKSVSTKWKKYSEKHEAIFVKQMLAAITNNQYGLHDSNKNTIWVVHPSRKKLHPWEEQFGCKGPINTFRIEDILGRGIIKLASGDRVLIHNGQYTYSSMRSLRITKDVHLIGVGNKVVFKDMWGQIKQTIANNRDKGDWRHDTLENQRQFLDIGWKCDAWMYDEKKAWPGCGVRIDNMQFDLTEALPDFELEYEEEVGHIVVHKASSLIMNNCIMQSQMHKSYGFVATDKSLLG
eukprot:213670_1